MSKWSLKTDAFKLEIDDDLDIAVMNETVHSLLLALITWKQTTAIKKLSVDLLGPPGSMKYTYDYELVDGRKWVEELEKKPDDWYTVATSGDQLAIKELIPQRDIRDRVMTLINTFAIKSIEAKWED